MLNLVIPLFPPPNYPVSCINSANTLPALSKQVYILIYSLHNQKTILATQCT